MKKLNFVTIGLLCVFFCTTPAYAILVDYHAEGQVVELFPGYTYDGLGWLNSDFTIHALIDSEKEYSYTGDYSTGYPQPGGSVDIYLTEYTQYLWDNVSLTLDGVDVPISNTHGGITVYRTINTTQGTFVSQGIGMTFTVQEYAPYVRFELGGVPPYGPGLTDTLPFDFPVSVAANEWTGVDGYVGGSAMSLYGLSIESLSVNPVPEPATLFLLGAGLAGLAVFGRKKFKKRGEGD